MTDSPTIWEGKDWDGGPGGCEIVRTSNPNVWQYNATTGYFSGYPSVELDREQIKKLYEALGKELGL